MQWSDYTTKDALHARFLLNAKARAVAYVAAAHIALERQATMKWNNITMTSALQQGCECEKTNASKCIRREPLVLVPRQKASCSTQGRTKELPNPLELLLPGLCLMHGE